MKDFPILDKKVAGRRLVYFDNAATTHKPVQVTEAITDYYDNHNGNVGRGLHVLCRESTDAYESARKKVAKFINAKPEEIIFTSNTTQSMNLLAYAHQKKNVVSTIMEHHSGYLPWKMVSKDVSIVDITDDGRLDMADYQDNITKDTDIVSAVHVSNVLGTVNPAKEMAKVAHESDALFVLDGAQSVPHMETDVKKLDCDFLAFSGHKMLGPMGVGVLYGKKDVLEDMKPPFVGGGMIISAQPMEYVGIPNRFEAGTPNVAGAVGLGAAIDYLEKTGMDKVERHEKELTKHTLDHLEEETYGPKDRVGIVSFNVSGVDDDEAGSILDENAIAVRSGHHCAQPLMKRLGIDGTIRMSFYLYNTKEEIDYALSIIDKIKSLA